MELRQRLLEEQPANDLTAKSSRAAVEKFATNWSTPEFGNFVEMLGGLVDSLGVEPGTDSWARMEAIWTRVIELEVGFWPEDLK
jgi:thiaminase